MSNHIFVVKTIFTDYDGEESYGYRVYDDYAKDYFNDFNKEHFERITDEEMLQHAYNNTTDVTDALFDFAVEMNDTIFVNGVPFEASSLRIEE